VIDEDRVVTYYASCMAQLAIADAPERLRKGASMLVAIRSWSHCSSQAPPTSCTWC
jgi:hypothetical protein